MRVLVTGAAGFIGGALVRALADRPGVSGVVAHDLSRPACPGPIGLAIAGDIAAIGQDLPADFGPDLVFHAAGITTAASEADPDRAFATNLGGTRALLAWCRGLPGPPRVVLTSSVAVFGDGEAAPDEESRPRPRTTYGATKLMAETLLADATRRGEVSGVVARLPVTAVRTVREGRPGAGYLSDLIRAGLARRPFTAPLGPDHAVPVASLGRTLRLLLALGAASDAPSLLHVPAFAATGRDAMAALAARGFPPEVAFALDPAVEALIAGWPSRLASRIAPRFGEDRPETMEDIVVAALGPGAA